MENVQITLGVPRIGNSLLLCTEEPTAGQVCKDFSVLHSDNQDFTFWLSEQQIWLPKIFLN